MTVKQLKDLIIELNIPDDAEVRVDDLDGYINPETIEYFIDFSKTKVCYIGWKSYEGNYN